VFRCFESPVVINCLAGKFGAAEWRLRDTQRRTDRGDTDGDASFGQRFRNWTKKVMRMHNRVQIRGANVQCEGFVRRTCIQRDRSNLQHKSQKPHPDDGFEIIRSQSARARSGPQLVQLPRSYNMTALWLWDVPMDTLCARAGNDKLHLVDTQLQ
jgi:hypothetical protein